MAAISCVGARATRSPSQVTKKPTTMSQKDAKANPQGKLYHTAKKYAPVPSMSGSRFNLSKALSSNRLGHIRKKKDALKTANLAAWPRVTKDLKEASVG